MIALAHAHDGNQAGVTQHIDSSVHEFGGAAAGIRIHGGQLFFSHLFHPHAAGMKGETFRFDPFASVKHRRYFRFHRSVRAWNDLSDTISPIRHGVDCI